MHVFIINKVGKVNHNQANKDGCSKCYFVHVDSSKGEGDRVHKFDHVFRNRGKEVAQPLQKTKLSPELT